MGVSLIFPCADCGASDSRDEAHAQGCPTLPPLSKAELVRLARNVERGWAEDAQRPEPEETPAAVPVEVPAPRRGAMMRDWLDSWRPEGARA